MDRLEEVLNAVQREFKVRREDLFAPTRSSADIAWARQVAMYLCHVAHPAASMTEIGRAFQRDRTTVKYACNKVEDWRGEGDDLDELLTKIEETINGSTAASV